ncbi:MAG TPA: SMP-30/gluconolactonase/LRE family protein, partial [Dehalococcoidia bacterium]|nr:SMP-30/gluconolactonase/LRE family protein [Dehalococcoidia bacterium]
NLFVCDHDRHAVLIVDPNGRTEIFADQAASYPLPLPNFCAFDAAGHLYVSSSTGPETISAADLLAHPRPIGQLFRFAPSGEGTLVADGLEFPNGIALTPDESAVYVLQSGPWNAVRVPIGSDRGLPSQREVASEKFSGLPDGLAFDQAGNAVVTLVMAPRDGRLRGLHRLITLRPDGTTEALAEDPTGKTLALPTNCAYGGPDLRTLYVASLKANHFAVLDVEVPGHPLYHQR